MPTLTVEEVATRIKTDRALDLSGVVVKGNVRICRQAPVGELPEEDFISRPLSETLRYVRLENCRIEGYLSLDGVAVQGECTLRDVSISGALSLGHATFEKNFHLERVFAASTSRAVFDARNVRVKGGMNFQACIFEGEVVINYLEAHYLWMWAVHVSTLSISRTMVSPGSFSTFPTITDLAGEIEPFGIRCDGYFAMSSVKIDGVLNLADSSISGDLQLDDLDVNGGILIGTTGTYPSFVGGDTTMRASNLPGGLKINRCLLGKLYLAQNQASTFTFGGSHGDANLLGHGAVFGDIELFETTLSGALRCQAVEVLRTIRIERCHLGHVDFDGQLGNESKGRRFLLPTQVNDGVEIRGSRIDGSVQFLASQIKRNTEQVQPAFEISSSTVGKHLMFWTGRYCENINSFSIAAALKNSDLVPGVEAFQEAGLAYNAKGVLTRFELPGWLVRAQVPGESKETPKEFSASRKGSLDRSDQDRLRLRRTAARVATRVDGRVRINQCQIQGDVRLSDLHAQHDIDLIELVVSGNIRADSEDIRYGRWKNEWGSISDAEEQGMNPTTECRALILKNCKIDGRVDLTGLVAGVAGAAGSTARTRSDGAEVEDDPALSVSYSTVGKIVDLVHPETAKRSGEGVRKKGSPATHGRDHHEAPTHHARLGGRMDVSGSTFGTVRLSGSLWKDLRAARAGDVKPESFYAALKATKDLDNEPEPLLKGHGTSFETLEFVHDLPPDVHDRPPIDLLDATVKTWGFSRWREKTGLGAFLARMLSQSKPRERVYFQVESYLNQVGNSEWSKKIRRDSVWRRRCKDFCDALPNPTKLKRVLRQKSYVATSDESTLGLRQVAPIVRILCLAVLALGVCAMQPWRIPPGKRSVAGPSSALAGWLAKLRLPVWLLAWVPAVLGFSRTLHPHWFPVSLLLVALPFVFPEVRACGLLFGSVANRLVTGNFTSPGRAFFLWIGVYAFATMFFWDIDHLDINSLYKKNFYENVAGEVSDGGPRTAASAPSARMPPSSDDAPLVCRAGQHAEAAIATIVPPAAPLALNRSQPNKVTVDVCEILGQWDLAHAFLFATRYVVPGAPSVFDEIDIDNTISGNRDVNAEFDCAKVAEQSLLHRCCAIYRPWLKEKTGATSPSWSPNKIFEFGYLHDWPVPWVALLIRGVSSLLLTLLGATIAARFSHRSG